MNFVRTSVAAFGFVTAMALASIPAQASQLIEIGTVSTPFIDARTGEALEATPVRIIRYEDGSTEIEPLPIAVDGDAPSGPFDLGAVGTWAIQYDSFSNGPSVLLGVLVGEAGCTSWGGPAELCGGGGLLLQLGVGSDALRASVGYAVLSGMGGSVDTYGNIGAVAFPIVGVGVKATMLKTWGDASDFTESLLRAQDDATYVGGELDVSMMFLKFSLGLFRKIEPSVLTDNERAWLLNLGAGVGF